MNEENLSRNSNIKMYTPIKIKKNENIKNEKYYLFKANTPHIYSNYLNKYDKNIIKSNNKFSKSIDKQKYKLSQNNKENIRILTTNNINIILNRKSTSINRIKKNKRNLNLNLLIDDNQRYNNTNNNLKNRFTYNFVKDTQKIHCSTIVFKRKNKNKNDLNKNNFHSTVISNLNSDSKKIKKNNNKKIVKKYLIKKELNNNNYSLSSNSKKIKSDGKSRNLETRNILNFKNKLINSPDSIFYYIYNFINKQKNIDNLEHKIYYSKIDMKKKFRYYKKDLEKLEQGTNNELYNLKRQIVPEQENRFIKKYN